MMPNETDVPVTTAAIVSLSTASWEGSDVSVACALVAVLSALATA